MRTFVLVKQKGSRYLFDANGFKIGVGDLLVVDTMYGIQTGFADEVDFVVSQNAEKYFCRAFETQIGDIKKVLAVISKECLDELLLYGKELMVKPDCKKCEK